MTPVPPPVRQPGARYLLPSERLVVSVRRHPVVLARFVFEVLGAGIVAGWLAAQVGPDNDDLLWWLFLAVCARAVWKAMEWSNDRFIVSDRRFMLVSGLLTRRVAMMPLRRVTDLTYEKPLVGRVVGYGTFVLESAGQDQALHKIGYLPSPDLLYAAVSDLLFGPGGIAAPKPAGGSEEE